MSNPSFDHDPSDPAAPRLRYEPWPYSPVNFYLDPVLLAGWNVERGTGRWESDDDKQFCHDIAAMPPGTKVPPETMARLRKIASPLRWVVR